MKKLTILFVALLVANVGFSQSSVGIKAGFTSSALSNLEDNDEFADYKRGSGLLVGVIGQFGINENVSVAGEINFQQKGQKTEGSFDFFGVTTKFENTTTLNYLEIPVLLRFTAGEDLRFFGKVGPYLGYAIGGTSKSESTVGGETESSKGKIKFGSEPENYTGDDVYTEDSFNRMELGVYVGAGIQKSLGAGSLIVDARFGVGLSDTNNTDEIYPSGKPDDYEPNKFNNFTISVGYLIPLGGE